MIAEITQEQRDGMRKAYEIMLDVTKDHHHACPCWMCEYRASMTPDDYFSYIAFITHEDGDKDYDAAEKRYKREWESITK